MMTKPDLTQLQSRDGLGNFLNQYGLLGEAVEVGTLTGDYARQIMSQWKGRKLHCIDPFEQQSDEVYKEPVNRTDWASVIQSCQSMAIQYSPRVELHKAYSPQAASLFEDESLDAVFIDGNHSYEAVSNDILAWWPKVQVGGVFGGHDFRNDTIWPQNCEVKKAVLEFLDRTGLRMHYTAPCGSWWVIKN